MNYEFVTPYSKAKVICEEEDLGSITTISWDEKNPNTLHITDKLSITNISEEEINAWKIGNKSPVEWVIDQYTTNKRKGKKGKSGNSVQGNPNTLGVECIKDLILRLITVSLESQKLVNSLPEIDEIESVDYKRIWKDMTR